MEVESILSLISDSCSTSEGSVINFHCGENLISNLSVISVCTSEGKWNQLQGSESVYLANKVHPEGTQQLMNFVSY